MKKFLILIFISLLVLPLFATSLWDGEEKTLTSEKDVQHLLSIKISPYKSKWTNFYNLDTTFNTIYGFATELNYRTNIYDYLYAAASVEYNGNIANREYIPNKYSSELPLALSLGYYQRVKNNLELNGDLSYGVKLGSLNNRFSLTLVYGKINLGINYYLENKLFITTGTSFSVSFDPNKIDNNFNSLVYSIAPIYVGLGMGV